MLLATEHIRRMRGGAQAHLMRCDDGGYYIVKFQNNPQHLRILANEMLATRLAARLGLCVPQVGVVEVRPELIAYTEDLSIQLGVGRIPCSAGKQFGSQFPGHPARLTIHDFLPDEQLGEVRNLSDFLGVFVFDKWTCNTNGRQAIFFREPEEAADFRAKQSGRPPNSPLREELVRLARPEPGQPEVVRLGPPPPSQVIPKTMMPEPDIASGKIPMSNRATMPDQVPAPNQAMMPYQVMMIDHGFCFNAGEWDFPDAPLRALYPRHRVYQGVAGMDAFEPWLARVERAMTEAVLGEEAGHIPPEWYADDWDALGRLIERLYARRKRLRELILLARNSGRDPFPNWKVKKHA